MGYIPPLSEIGSPCTLGGEPEIAPGVRGYAMKVPDGRVFIPLIFADKPGDGAVSQFLDSLDSKCCVVNVMSPKLRQMLIYKGWIKSIEEGNDVWQKAVKL